MEDKGTPRAEVVYDPEAGTNKNATSASNTTAGRSATCWVALTILTLILLLGYLALCSFLIAYFFLSLIFNELSNRETAFVNAAAIVLGVTAGLTALGSFVYAVWVAVKDARPPRLMLYTLHTAPCLVHGVFVLTPLTVAVSRVVAGKPRSEDFW